ncbi:hypothetical protein BC938DRAFT_476356, partial [Jimgerdemannia flammicorona]
GEPYTAASDVYCLGTLFWQFVVGVPPRGTAAELMTDGMREEMVPEMPAEYENVIRACWNPDPVKRPSAKEVVEMLRTNATAIREHLVKSSTIKYIKAREKEYMAKTESTIFFAESQVSRSQFHVYKDLMEYSRRISATTDNAPT